MCFCRAIAAFESYLVSIYGSSSRELHSLQAWKAIGNYRHIPTNQESQRIAKSIKIHKFVYSVFQLNVYAYVTIAFCNAERSSINMLKSKLLVYENYIVYFNSVA